MATLNNFQQAKPEKPKEDPLNYKQVALVLGATFILYFLIGSMKDNIREDISKIDKRIDYVLFQNASYEKNMKALSGTECGTCHLSPSMVLPKTTLSMTQFVAYVRGSNRFAQNSQMPKYDEKKFSDGDLERLWKGLY